MDVIEKEMTKDELLFEVAMLAGEITLRSGAEVYRVEDTMMRIFEKSKNKRGEVYVNITGIFATFFDELNQSVTRIIRIDERDNNLNKIYITNQISRDLCEDKISLSESYRRLNEVKTSRLYKKKTALLCTVLSPMFFSILFGGSLADFFVAGLAAGSMVLAEHIFEKFVLNDFLASVIKGMFIVISTFSVKLLYPSIDESVVIISALMLMVPGVPITNAIRDMLQKNYMSGLARSAEAFVRALAIAVGTGTGIGAFELIKGIFVQCL